jgi:hypothetical protein
MNKKNKSILEKRDIEVLLELPRRAVICREGRLYQWIEGTDIENSAALMSSLNKMDKGDKNYAWINGSGPFIDFLDKFMQMTSSEAHKEMRDQFKEMMK